MRYQHGLLPSLHKRRVGRAEEEEKEESSVFCAGTRVASLARMGVVKLIYSVHALFQGFLHDSSNW